MNVIEEAKKIPGIAGIYYKNLLTGELLLYNENRKFHPASIIKLPVFMAISKMVHEQRADWNEKIKITYDVRVPSCGAFNAFTDEPTVDIKTLCNLMIVISDNTAANVLIKRFGIDNLNNEFRKMGLKFTHLERLFFDDHMQEKGFNNKAVPCEIGMLLEQLYGGDFISPQVSKDILSVLLEQQDRSRIPAYIEDFCPVGNKTGDAAGITGDAALILGQNPFVLVIIFNETINPVANEFMSHAARDIFKEVNINA